MKNDRIMHVEDYMIHYGGNGLGTVLEVFQDISRLYTLDDYIFKASVKMDGRPSVFIGNFQSCEDDGFFVAKKSIFNKTPILYKSIEEIERHIEKDDLKRVMISLFENYSKLRIQGVYQGDLLFTKEDLFEMDNFSEKSIAFHPNSIVYRVSKDSETGNKINQSDIGVAWHTVYRGTNVKGISVASEKEIRFNEKLIENTFNYYCNPFNVKLQDSNYMQEYSKLCSLFYRTDFDIMNIAAHNNLSSIRINAAINAIYKSHYDQELTVDFLFDHLLSYLDLNEDKEGTSVVKSLIKFHGPLKVKKFFEIYLQTVIVKNEFLKAIDTSHIPFVPEYHQILERGQEPNTDVIRIIEGGHEGFVHHSRRGDTMKFVNRATFSRFNFGNAIRKGWS